MNSMDNIEKVKLITNQVIDVSLDKYKTKRIKPGEVDGKRGEERTVVDWQPLENLVILRAVHKLGDIKGIGDKSEFDLSIALIVVAVGELVQNVEIGDRVKLRPHAAHGEKVVSISNKEKFGFDNFYIYAEYDISAKYIGNDEKSNDDDGKGNST